MKPIKSTHPDKNLDINLSKLQSYPVSLIKNYRYTYNVKQIQ